MSTKDLLDKIDQASAESIKTIETEAAAMVTTITESAQAELTKISDDAQAAADKTAAAVERATLAKARQAGKLAVQTAKRSAFDAIMITAQKIAVGDDSAKAQAWADKEADLEMVLSKQLG